MTSTNVLCIIDMQHGMAAGDSERFNPEGVEVINNIIREVVLAKQLQYRIVIVEFDYSELEHALTIERIMKAVGKNYVRVLKKKADGSLEIIKVLGKVIPEKIRVCGQITNCCVLETVLGLRLYYGVDKVDVIADAVYPFLWDESCVRDPSLRQGEKP